MMTLYPCPTAIIVLQDFLNKQARLFLANLQLLGFSFQINAQKTVNRVVNNKAGQTEALNVAVYIVKVTRGDETAVQRIVKTK